MDKIEVSDQIFLKKPTIEDAPAIFKLVDSNRSHLRKFLNWLDQNTKKEHTEKFLLSQQKGMLFAIYYNEAIVGLVDYHSWDKMNRKAEIGYWMDEGHQGKGIMTRSVKTLIDYGFKEMNLHRIEILPAVENVRSQKIPQTLSFQLEGIMKDALWLYDHFVDLQLYALINHA